MPEANPATPQKDSAAQGSGALDAAAIQKLVADTVSAALKPVSDTLGQLAANQKVLADTFAADQQKAAEAAKATATATTTPAKKDEAPKPITLEDVTKVAGDSVATILKTRDEQAASNAARSAFVAEKLKGLPAAYQGQLGNDPAKWAEQEAAIRTQFQADLKALGAKIPDVNGGDAGGESGSGGQTPGQPNPAATAAATGNLSPGQAAFAAGIELPKH